MGISVTICWLVSIDMILKDTFSMIWRAVQGLGSSHIRDGTTVTAFMFRWRVCLEPVRKPRALGNHHYFAHI